MPYDQKTVEIYTEIVRIQRVFQLLNCVPHCVDLPSSSGQD